MIEYVPLMPIQRWFFEQEFVAPHHWNVAGIFQTREKLSAPLAEQAVYALVEHHDALRSRFKRTETGWQQFVIPNEPMGTFVHSDLSKLSKGSQDAAIRETSENLQSSLDLECGPMLRVGLFEMGPNRPGCIVFVFHHLICDMVSWRILLEDFETVYRQLNNRLPIRLKEETTSFKQWSEFLTNYGNSSAMSEQLSYWTRDKHRRTFELPTDYDNGENTEGSVITIEKALSIRETTALLEHVPHSLGVDLHSALLTALLMAFYEWTGERFVRSLSVHHGRVSTFDKVDLKRTVGWLMTNFAIDLEIDNTNNLRAMLMEVKQQLDNIASYGLGYGLLKYLNTEAAVQETMRAMPEPQCSFVYQGKYDKNVSENSLFRPYLTLNQELGGLRRSKLNTRKHLLLNFWPGIYQGRFRLYLRFGRQLHDYHTIEGLANGYMSALRSIIQMR